MDQHLRWFVNSPRHTGCINFWKATQGRGKKGNQAPRKRSRKTAETTATIAAPLLEMEATATIAESIADIVPQRPRSTLTQCERVSTNPIYFHDTKREKIAKYASSTSAK